MLLLVLLVVWVLLIGFLAIWTVGFQGYIYTEPVKNIEWRAPIAGTVLALFLTGWIFLDYSSPTSYRTLVEFNPEIALPPYKEFRIVTQEGNEELYKQAKDARGRVIYQKDGKSNGPQPPGRPVRVIVKEDDQDVAFEPDRDTKGRFKIEPGTLLTYRDNKGRVMEEGQLGRVSTFRTTNLVANLLLNTVHFALWFVVLWLVLEYRWEHAFGLAIVFYLAAMLFLLPPMLSKAEEVASPGIPVRVEQQEK